MNERALPERIRNKAKVSADGEHAWRMDDVEEVVLAARDRGLACADGEVQFKFPDGICEAYWISFTADERQAGELWQDYVVRCADEVTSRFRQVCRDTDFRKLAREWDFIAQKMDQEGCDPELYLWFPLYFEAEPPN